MGQIGRFVAQEDYPVLIVESVRSLIRLFSPTKFWVLNWLVSLEIKMADLSMSHSYRCKQRLTETLFSRKNHPQVLKNFFRAGIKSIVLNSF